MQRHVLIQEGQNVSNDCDFDKLLISLRPLLGLGTLLVGLGVWGCICCCPNRYFIEMFRHIVNVSSSRLQLSKKMSVVSCLLYRSCLPKDFNADWIQIGRI